MNGHGIHMDTIAVDAQQIDEFKASLQGGQLPVSWRPQSEINEQGITRKYGQKLEDIKSNGHNTIID